MKKGTRKIKNLGFVDVIYAYGRWTYGEWNMKAILKFKGEIYELEEVYSTPIDDCTYGRRCIKKLHLDDLNGRQFGLSDFSRWDEMKSSIHYLMGLFITTGATEKACEEQNDDGLFSRFVDGVEVEAVNPEAEDPT